MKKNLALTIVNVAFIIFVGWLIYFSKDINNVVSLIFLLVLNGVLGMIMD